MPTARTAPLSRAKLFALVAADLRRVDKVIGVETICCADVVTAISKHLTASGGKRLRPALVLLSARACGDTGEAPIRLAAVMELIHAATLVHDDVIDGAAVRRGRPSANSVWGNQVSVLAGDWLYMQAFSLAVRERNFAILDLLVDLTQMMVEGELMQAELIGQLDITEHQNQDLIHRKTACLLSACSRTGALLAGCDERTEEHLRNYGWNLGMAFQLIDDVLDFEASEADLGKPVGNDLREGKVTLPMILALQACTLRRARLGGNRGARTELRIRHARADSGDPGPLRNDRRSPQAGDGLLRISARGIGCAAREPLQARSARRRAAVGRRPGQLAVASGHNS